MVIWTSAVLHMKIPTFFEFQLTMTKVPKQNATPIDTSNSDFKALCFTNKVINNNAQTRMTKKQDLDQQYVTKPLKTKKKNEKKQNPFACEELRSNGKYTEKCTHISQNKLQCRI